MTLTVKDCKNATEKKMINGKFPYYIQGITVITLNVILQ